jgi:hypothetical protein
VQLKDDQARIRNQSVDGESFGCQNPREPFPGVIMSSELLSLMQEADSAVLAVEIANRAVVAATQALQNARAATLDPQDQLAALLRRAEAAGISGRSLKQAAEARLEVLISLGLDLGQPAVPGVGGGPPDQGGQRQRASRKSRITETEIPAVKTAVGNTLNDKDGIETSTVAGSGAQEEEVVLSSQPEAALSEVVQQEVEADPEMISAEDPPEYVSPTAPSLPGPEVAPSEEKEETAAQKAQADLPPAVDEMDLEISQSAEPAGEYAPAAQSAEPSVPHEDAHTAAVTAEAERPEPAPEPAPTPVPAPVKRPAFMTRPPATVTVPGFGKST